MRKTLFRLLAVSIVAAVVTISLCNSRSTLPPDMEPFTEIRKAVQDKNPDDIRSIVLTTYFTKDPLVITRRDDIAALLIGLQKAVRPKTRYGDAVLRVRVNWRDGKESPSWGFSNTGGTKRALGEDFSKAFNRVVPPDRKISLDSP